MWDAEAVRGEGRGYACPLPANPPGIDFGVVMHCRKRLVTSRQGTGTSLYFFYSVRCVYSRLWHRVPNTILFFGFGLSSSGLYSLRPYTDKKEKKIFLIYKDIQNGAVAKSYMTNCLLINGEILAYIFPHI
jgi:hypothetical protein